MNRYILSPRAQADIDAIWDYTAEQWTVDQAESYVVEIRDAIRNLAENPKLGQKLDAVRAKYRRYPVNSHVIFYRIKGGAIEIIRVLHQRMDFESQL